MPRHQLLAQPALDKRLRKIIVSHAIAQAAAIAFRES
jgi:hypothetical protein